MIQRTQQDWSVGSVVKIGFLSLTVKAAIATPGDFKPDAYILVNKAGTQLYKFVPHNGVEKISPFEAREMIADSWVAADRVAAQAVEHAKQSARAIAEINDIIFP
ncbi:MAG TPA: hypothetical protein VF783_14075 [Terriglobales bacterium]